MRLDTAVLPSLAPDKKIAAWAASACVSVLAVFATFFRIADPPVYLWDEARLAINAIEMTGASNPLVVTFHGQPDLWSTKPPLAVWLTALSLKTFGISEFALRLPAALAAALTIYMVYVFVSKVTSSLSMGILSALFLIGTGGYLDMHVARSADYDSIFVLFLTLTTFLLFIASENADDDRRKASRLMFAAAASFTCAVLTKGVAAILILPGYVLYAFCSGKLRSLARLRSTWIATASGLLVILVYFVARELSAPGFAAAMWENDFAGRFVRVSSGHAASFSYYLDGLLSPWPLEIRGPLWEEPYVRSAFPWSWAVVPAAIFGLTSSSPPRFRSSLFVLCCLAGLLITISAAATKLPWYVAPAYPLIAVICALGSYELVVRLEHAGTRGSSALGQAVKTGAHACAIIFVAMNMWKIEKQVRYGPRFSENALPSLLRSVTRMTASPDVLVTVVGNGVWRTPSVIDGSLKGTEPYDAQEEFYVLQRRSRGGMARIVQNPVRPKAGEVVVTCRPEVPSQENLGATPNCKAITGPRVEKAP